MSFDEWRGDSPWDNLDFVVDLGCGKLKKGRIGVDRWSAPGVDLIMNLDDVDVMLPWPDSSVESIVSHHCSPGDEEVLTTRGHVGIGELDDSLRLAAASRQRCLTWGGGRGAKYHVLPIARRGFEFRRAVRAYAGDLICVETRRSRTRVTPNHMVLVRMRPEFFTAGYVVYLMRRGDWWRIGMVTAARSKASGVSSLMGRRIHQRADAVWILGVFRDRQEAWLAEMRLQAEYGISGAGFEPGGTKESGKTVAPEAFHELHRSLADQSKHRARRLLYDHGLLENYPLIAEATFRSSFCFTTAAANLRCLRDWVDIPVAPQEFMDLKVGSVRPSYERASISVQQFSGDVFSLDVPPLHHYVSGGAVVHNCLEHVGLGFIPLVDEIYRVLQSGGILRAITPLFPSRSAVEDPDHKRYFMEQTWESFCGFPGDGPREHWQASFSVPYSKARFEMVDKICTPPVEPGSEWGQDDVREIRVALRARK